MKQITYTLDNDLSFAEMAKQVIADPLYARASYRLQLVFEPSFTNEQMLQQLARADQALPNTTTIAMTTMGAVATDVEVPKHTTCTFLLFEHAHVHVDAFDCHHMSPLVAAQRFCKKLNSYEDVRGVLCIPSRSALDSHTFVEAIGRCHPDIPLFGAKAGTRTFANDQSSFYVGTNRYDQGILAVSFCGKDLYVLPTFNLGWRPIGKDHVVTSCDHNGLVHTMDNLPAVSIYQHYLKVGLDDHFFDNVCPFPLLVRNGKQLMARVPIGFTENGSLRFPTSFELGSHARFSYAHPNDLMRGSTESANKMATFRPQALVLFSCVNRRVFLGNERADRELSFYRYACPSMAWAYGSGEIMHTFEGGGILNSTIVALGLREGIPTGPLPNPLPDPISAAGERPIPLSERLFTFLDATTTEFSHTVEELEFLAKRDPLTGAFNRRRMEEVLHYELSKRRTQNDLVLLMYDIDHFKDVNDTYGHDTGDIVLKDLTRCVQTCIREGDSLGRWGGEEFLCLLINLSMHHARVVAERIRVYVENTTFLRVGHVTISIGITAARADDTVDSFFHRVDMALYDAKHTGRNCIREL